MRKCLCCYQPLEEEVFEYHSKCSKALFETSTPPQLDLNQDEVEGLALEIIKKKIAVTGVQAKMSLSLAKTKASLPSKLTIVGLWGNYILKLPSAIYSELPEVEAITMQMAKLAKIAVVPHGLIRLTSGELCYITRRIDRLKGNNLHMEDMCQLADKLTEYKYQGSYEQVATLIRQYSSNPGLDTVNFAEQILFCFLTGNSDMHLKNFSILQEGGNSFNLSPAYDMVATVLVHPSDKEDLALNLNGRKKRLKLRDFHSAFSTMKLTEVQQNNIISKMVAAKNTWFSCIESSFLSHEKKDAYQQLLEDRFKRLNL